MATTTDSITVLDHCLVAPPSMAATSAAEIHGPLTFLDMNWLHFSPIQQLVFYEIPHLSTSQFIGDIIPKLKDSLSLTLKYFPVLAGNLIVHPNSDSAMPEIRYTSGNGVALTIAECDNPNDFHRLVADVERDCAEFHRLIPELKSSSILHHNEDLESVVSSTPVLALQVTLFPDVGLSIGISNHHTVGDARSIFHFMKTWAILHSKLSQYNKDPDAELLVSGSLPVFDKNLIQDKKGLAKIVLQKWNSFIKRRKSLISESTPSTIVKKVHKTFVISAKQVKNFKNSVPKLVHVSSFTVVCSYVWTCIIKSRLLINHDDDDGEHRHFLFTADCRERSDPPVPANYFGNCLVAGITNAETAELAGERGFLIAAELLGRTIHEKFKRKDAVFDGVETRFDTIKELMALKPDKIVSVAGSTRFNYYSLDFGWGSPVKFEFISINQTGAISVGGSRDSDGSVEVGVCLTESEMNAFIRIFMEGL